MTTTVRDLEPRPLWNYFEDLNAVPRGSKQEDRAVQFIQDFGNRLGLDTTTDSIGNVIIRKPATAGMEDRVAIVLQSHLDMVHQKNADVDFDFSTCGIQTVVDGDWVKARGTTLGADNGIGVASIMTILASEDIPHPAVEGLFTIDEETGMTGAQGLSGGLLHGKILLNLDTEDDDELTIGCAGGVDVSVSRAYEPQTTPEGMIGYRLTVRGLTGGHSGMDIHRGRGNANKWMNRLLWNASQKVTLRIGQIDGGGLRNAIPRESVAQFAVPEAEAKMLEQQVRLMGDLLLAEHQLTDPDAQIELISEAAPSSLLPDDLKRLLLATIYACPCGIHRMSPSIKNLVQTSNNLARVLVADGQIGIHCLTRSSVNSERDDLANAICANFDLLGGQVEQKGAYPGWEPVPDAGIVRLMSELYQSLFGQSAHVAACHAGLECGILGKNYPEVQMISFGPNIRGAHSPDERVQISSVQKYWKFLLATLERIPTST